MWANNANRAWEHLHLAPSNTESVGEGRTTLALASLNRTVARKKAELASVYSSISRILSSQSFRTFAEASYLDTTLQDVGGEHLQSFPKPLNFHSAVVFRSFIEALQDRNR